MIEDQNIFFVKTMFVNKNGTNIPSEWFKLI